MRNVISAVEIIIDKHLPVAVDFISAAVKVVELAHPERRHAFDQAAEEVVQRGSLRVEIYEYKLLPGFRLHREQAVSLTLKIFDAVEFWHAFQRAIQAIVPAVVRTMQERSLAAGLGDDRRGMMTAYVVEAAQNSVMASHHNNRFAGDAGCDKLARLFHLLDPSHHLPGPAENGLSLKRRDSGVDIPRRRDRGGILQWCFVVVLSENLRNRLVRGLHAPIARFRTSRNWVTRASFFSCRSPCRRNRPGSSSSVSSAS